MSLAYTYQQIIDLSAKLAGTIAEVRESDSEALGPRGSAMLEAVRAIVGAAVYIAVDRRDALFPDAADETLAKKLGGAK